MLNDPLASVSTAGLCLDLPPDAPVLTAWSVRSVTIPVQRALLRAAHLTLTVNAPDELTARDLFAKRGSSPSSAGAGSGPGVVTGGASTTVPVTVSGSLPVW